MAATTGANLGIEHTWSVGEDGWNDGMDSNLVKLDTVVQCAVKDASLSSPPVSPTEGDRYIVNGTGSGAWVGYDNKLVVYSGGVWVAYTPKEGWWCYDIDSGYYKKYNGTTWENMINATVPEKLTEIFSRADDGDGAYRTLINVQAGGASSDTWVTNPNWNKAVDGLVCASIFGGGSAGDPHLLGYRYHYAREVGPITNIVLDCVVTDTSLVLALVRNANFVQSSKTVSNGGITVTPNTPPGSTTVSLATALENANESVYVEYQDPNMLVEVGGTIPSYGSVGGGAYDSQVWQNLMNHCVHSAHARIAGGDHGTIIGGSYGQIRGGSYGVMVGGTQNEIGPSAGNGSGCFAGLRNRAYGAGSWCLGGQENQANGAYTVSFGGYRVNLVGTASAGTGRNNIHYGSDGLVAGDGNTLYGNYSVATGKSQTNGVNHHYGLLEPGLGGRTRTPHNKVRYAVRDSGDANAVMRQMDDVGLSVMTTGTTSSYMLFDDGTDTLTIPTGCVWNCTLKVVARNHAPRPAVFNIEFAAHINSGSAVVNVIETRSYVHSGHGTSTNAASITVQASGAGIKVLWQPRADIATASEVAAVLTILEVAASP